MDGKPGWFPSSYYETSYVASEASNQEKELVADPVRRQSKSIERQKKGGRKVGDKAVGILQKQQGTFGAALWEL